MRLPQRPFHRAARHAAALLGTLPCLAFACSSSPYVGDICIVAGQFCPNDYTFDAGKVVKSVEYLPADGRILNIHGYEILFGVIGTRFGGDKVSTFALPDLRGRAAVGAGLGDGLPAVALAQPLGQQQVTLARTQIPVPLHIHAATFAPTTAKVGAEVQATGNTLKIGATLAAGGTTAGAVAVPPAGTAYLAAVSAMAGFSKAALDGPYTNDTSGAGGKAKLPADVTVSGDAPRAATRIKVAALEGGSIAFSPTADAVGAAPAPVSTQSAALGLTACISTMGTYPPKSN